MHDARWRCRVILASYALSLFAQSGGCGRKDEDQAGNAGQPTTVPAHTSLNTACPEVRVQLAANAPSFDIALDGPCVVTDADGNSIWEAATRIEKQRVVPLSDGRQGFQFANWAFPLTQINILPKIDGSLSLRFSDRMEPIRYQGSLRCSMSEAGGFELINVIDLESYLHGVVLNEMPGWFSPAALRAQAIAARTYALYQSSIRARNRNWDLVATEGSQVYGGLAGQDRAREGIEAVDSTRGVVCVWDGGDGPRIFCTYYSSTCGGRTQPVSALRNDQAIPPLIGNVPCTYCRNSKYYRWGPERILKSAAGQAVGERYPRVKELGPIETVEVVETTTDGRALRIRMTGRAGQSVMLRAEDFRLAVDSTGRVIRSTHFQLLPDGDSLIFADGQGYGHGVGMCQWGADGLAREGRSAEEILSYYYPGSRLISAYR